MQALKKLCKINTASAAHNGLEITTSTHKLTSKRIATPFGCATKQILLIPIHDCTIMQHTAGCTTPSLREPVERQQTANIDLADR